MTSRILVVDDVEPNVRLLEAKLAIEYYEVVTAQDGASCLQAARAERPDIILLDVMMPGMDGFETCRRLKADPATRDIPVMLISALDGREDRIKGLEAGADEFFTKPIDDVVMLALLRSRVRAKALLDNLRLGRPASAAPAVPAGGGRVLIVDDNSHQAEKIRDSLEGRQAVILADPGEALREAARGFDLVIANLAASGFDGLRLLAQLKSGYRTGRTPVLGVADPADRPRLIKALELGADDLVVRPVDPEELAIRARRMIDRKRTIDALIAPLAPAAAPAAGEAEELSQRPAPHRFAWDGSQIQAAPALADPEQEETTEDILVELRAKVGAALEGLVGNHADERLEQSMTAFLECISGPAEGMRSGRLLMRYRSLQADAAAYGDPASERERTIKMLVDDVAASASNLIVMYPDLRAIEEARLSLELTGVAGLREDLEAIAAAAAESPVVSAEAVEALTEMTAEAAASALDTPLTIEPSWRRASETKATVSIGLQLLTVRNFCAAVLKSVGREVAAVAAESAREARAAIPRGVGSGVERVVSGSVVLALVSVVAALAGPLAGIAALAVTFRPLAERAKKIRDAIEPEGG